MQPNMHGDDTAECSEKKPMRAIAHRGDINPRKWRCSSHPFQKGLETFLIIRAYHSDSSDGGNAERNRTRDSTRRRLRDDVHGMDRPFSAFETVMIALAHYASWSDCFEACDSSAHYAYFDDGDRRGFSVAFDLIRAYFENDVETHSIDAGRVGI